MFTYNIERALTIFFKKKAHIWANVNKKWSEWKIKMNKNLKCEVKDTNTQCTLKVKSKWLSFLWKKGLILAANRQLVRVGKTVCN